MPDMFDQPELPPPLVSNQTMSEMEYDRQRAELERLYGGPDAADKEVLAKRDQAWAQLFLRTGWPQEKLAEKEGKSQSWVARRLTFGRFLHFMPMGINPDSPPLPADLTERKFRGVWERTKKGDERDRFKEVYRKLTAPPDPDAPKPKRPSLKKDILESGIIDGKWRPAEKIAAEIEVEDVQHVSDTLQNAQDQGLFGLKVESKKVGTKRHWRLFPADKTVTVHELTEKLMPILKALKEQANDHMAHWSPPIVLKHLGLFERYLKEWAE
jgi:hypothetical protein